MAAVKTGKMVKYLICLFAAAAVMILAGGAKMKFSAESYNARVALIRTVALHFVSASQSAGELRHLAEKSPEYLLYAASSSELKRVEAGIPE